MTHSESTATPAIDWNGPLEAVHEDGWVVDVELRGSGTMRTIEPFLEGNGQTVGFFKEDGTHEWSNIRWRIRNRRPEPQADDGEVPSGYHAGPWVDDDDGRTPDFPIGSKYQMRGTRHGNVNMKVHTMGTRGGSVDTQYRLLTPIVDGEWVRVKRMSEVECMEMYKAYTGRVVVPLAMFHELGLLRDPTPAERAATALNLTPEQVQAVWDWRDGEGKGDAPRYPPLHHRPPPAALPVREPEPWRCDGGGGYP